MSRGDAHQFGAMLRVVVELDDRLAQRRAWERDWFDPEPYLGWDG